MIFVYVNDKDFKYLKGAVKTTKASELRKKKS